MKFQILLPILVVSAIAAPQCIPSASEIVSKDLAYAYAVSFQAPTTSETMNCIKSQGYQAAFIRGFNWEGNGSFDANSVASVRYAYYAGLGIEIYMYPQQKSTYSGGQQLDMMVRALSDNGIVIRTVWIVVASPSMFSKDPISNNAFVRSIITRAQQLGITVGIFTNQSDWTSITNNWLTVDPDVLLWYWNTRGNGASNASPPNFDDYVAFGGFKTVLAKQFDNGETLCELPLSRNVYSVGMASAKRSATFVAPEGKIVAGGIGL